MSDNLRQRRGKKSTTASGGASALLSSTTTDAGGASDHNGETTPIEQLRNAQAKLIISRTRTADLHTAWRGQLFRLSLIVVFVTIHQLQSSISSCITEIKQSSPAAGDNQESGVASVPGAEAIRVMFGDSFCEILGVVIASLLAYFLAVSEHQNTAFKLDAWQYMLSSALVPIALGYYFNFKQVGCMGVGIGEEDPAADDKRHQFPVVVIYHTIVTFAYWFMKSGMQQCEDHVKLVTDSMKDFERMEEKMELKNTLKKLKAKDMKQKETLKKLKTKAKK